MASWLSTAVCGFDPRLFEAAAGGRVDDVLSAARQRPDLIDAAESIFTGRTPMHAAARRGHAAVIEALVGLGSTAVDRRDKEGWTPMHAAAVEGHVVAIETLQRCGSAALDQPDNFGWTPMHLAAFNGRARVIETLVRLGATAIDGRDNDGDTPLMLAVSRRELTAAEMLVAAGAQLASAEAVQLRRGLCEERVAELRLGMFFSRSLVERLLSALT